jgi:hypothetical protein
MEESYWTTKPRSNSGVRKGVEYIQVIKTNNYTRMAYHLRTTFHPSPIKVYNRQKAPPTGIPNGVPSIFFPSKTEDTRRRPLRPFMFASEPELGIVTVLCTSTSERRLREIGIWLFEDVRVCAICLMG